MILQPRPRSLITAALGNNLNNHALVDQWADHVINGFSHAENLHMLLVNVANSLAMANWTSMSTLLHTKSYY